MRLDKQTDYALRVMMFLAANRQRRCTVAEISERYAISQAHLTKVVHLLGKAGFIETTRGRHGGIRLSGEGSQVSVGAVVRRMENDLAPAECHRTPHGTCLITGCCRLKSVLSMAMERFLEVLDSYTISALVRDNAALEQLLRADSERPRHRV